MCEFALRRPPAVAALSSCRQRWRMSATSEGGRTVLPPFYPPVFKMLALLAGPSSAHAAITMFQEELKASSACRERA